MGPRRPLQRRFEIIETEDNTPDINPQKLSFRSGAARWLGAPWARGFALEASDSELCARRRRCRAS